MKQRESRRGLVDWITLAVAGAIVTWFGTVAVMFVYGHIDAFLAGLFNIIPLYCCQIVVHEAAHGNIFRQRKVGRWLNIVIGYLFAAFLFWDFRTFRHLHMRHHHATNDPEQDVDWLPPKTSVLKRFLLAFTFLFHALVVAVRQIFPVGRPPRDRLLIVASWCVFYAGAWLVIFLAPVEALAIWIVPAVIATALLTLAHWSLHTEAEATTSPFEMTRVISASGLLGRIVSWAYLFQNYHLVHHLFPYVPFHGMGDISKRMAPIFPQEDVEIVDLDRICTGGEPVAESGQNLKSAQQLNL